MVVVLLFKDARVPPVRLRHGLELSEQHSIDAYEVDQVDLA